MAVIKRLDRHLQALIRAHAADMGRSDDGSGSEGERDDGRPCDKYAHLSTEEALRKCSKSYRDKKVKTARDFMHNESERSDDGSDSDADTNGNYRGFVEEEIRYESDADELDSPERKLGGRKRLKRRRIVSDDEKSESLEVDDSKEEEEEEEDDDVIASATSDSEGVSEEEEDDASSSGMSVEELRTKRAKREAASSPRKFKPRAASPPPKSKLPVAAAPRAASPPPKSKLPLAAAPRAASPPPKLMPSAVSPAPKAAAPVADVLDKKLLHAMLHGGTLFDDVSELVLEVKDRVRQVQSGSASGLEYFQKQVGIMLEQFPDAEPLLRASTLDYLKVGGVGGEACALTSELATGQLVLSLDDGKKVALPVMADRTRTELARRIHVAGRYTRADWGAFKEVSTNDLTHWWVHNLIRLLQYKSTGDAEWK